MTAAEKVDRADSMITKTMLMHKNLEPDKSKIAQFIAMNVAFKHVHQEVKEKYPNTYLDAANMFCSVVDVYRDCGAYESCKDGSFEACLDFHGISRTRQKLKELSMLLGVANYTIEQEEL